ncbi:hypothetical protein OG590_38820 (plasmid) [Streptomyces goshikiensis]|uniref:hypothetical protein n=1 Tax=Streptomyces goshikiensis TaxID=1942 RepID=UPI00386E32E3|nr:hypothetical protein OG590_38820 [Streptomyces goshikiensis]
MREGEKAQLLEEVRQVLAGSGFAELGGDTGGLLLRSGSDGVLIVWQPTGIVRAVTYVHGHEEGHELERLTSLPGLHQAAGAAMAAILEGAGYEARPGPDDMLLVTRPA